MKDLYQLYDKYNYLFSTLWLWDQVPKYCEDVLFLVGLYNSFLNEFKSDSIEFNNILKKFGELMKTITIPGETNCKVRYSIGELHLYEPPVEKTHHHDNTSLGPETRPTPEGILDNAHNPISQEVVSSSSMSIREQDRRDTENSHRSEESDPSKLAATLVLRESVGRRQPHENLEHSDPHESSRRQQSFVSRGPYGPGGYYEQVEYREAQETFPPEEDSYSGTKQLEGHLPGKENAGFMTNVQSAISGFMNGVDPVPVVGVSGGMGALFLLFRLDLSSEEEEDAHVEFLVVSVDISQEEFPDMKSFMMEALDPVQLIYPTRLNRNITLFLHKITVY
ncbi:hypothetical protein PVC01_000084500 [Plasmodium vivax]|uniref:Uncharacterized protein n=1 Tax=Plasmodium vivax TaxID=5855 RepID=A0A1G4E4A0_PLAVI|nr:hypothetical protein PVC01_000084500 [Plasmodium vivax]